MTTVPHDLGSKQDAQTIQQTSHRPAMRDTSGHWVLAFVFLGLPAMFLTMLAFAFLAS